MKKLTKTKTLKKVAILTFLTFLIAGLVIVGLDKSSCVEAGTCEEAFDNFTNANYAYSTAFASYYYGSPVSCQDECFGNPNPN